MSLTDALAPESERADDIEAQARTQGWKPEAEWRGPKDKWLPAAEFLEKTQHDFPILLDRLRVLGDRHTKLERTLEKTSTDLAEANKRLDDTGKVMSEFVVQAQTREQRSYDRARADLQGQADTAGRTGDTAAYQTATEALAKLDPPAAPAKPAAAEPPKPAAPPVPELSPVTQQWIKDNMRIMGDPVLNTIAVEAHSELLKSGLSEAEAFGKLADVVAERAPWKFPEKNLGRRGAAAAVLASSGGGSRPINTRTYDNLPADAKAQCDRYVTTIKGFTREQYIKDYEWE